MPPIATNSSCGTLVSLDDDYKTNDAPLTLTSSASYQDFVRTELLLPDNEDYDDFDEDEDTDFCFDDFRIVQEEVGDYYHETKNERKQSLYIPSSPHTPIDRHLSFIPSIAESNESLTLRPTERLCDHDNTEDPKRILNVCQGEIAHVTSDSYDVIASEDATTCHILAFRSQSKTSSKPLVSLTHVDGVEYGSCLRSMVQEHKRYHLSADEMNTLIEVDVHIIGGYNDPDGTSSKITNFLMDFLVQISNEEVGVMTFTLQTAMMSCMNQDNHGHHSGPVVRSLGMNICNGDVFTVEFGDQCVQGPAKELRSVRLWAQLTSPSTTRKLAVIHSASHPMQEGSYLTIEPFYYAPFRDIDAMLQLPDHILLEYTSTSPDLESIHFCSMVRKTLRFMKCVKPQKVFGDKCTSPYIFQLVKRKTFVAGGVRCINKWELVTNTHR